MGVHKKINVMSGLAIGSAFLSFVFLIAYIAIILAYSGGTGQKFSIPVSAIACLAIFIILLIVFAILDVIIGIYALVKIDKFSEKGFVWTIVGLCVVGFFLGGYIGICCMIAVIVMTCIDKQQKKGMMNKKKEGKDTSFTGTATVMTAPLLNTIYPAGTPSAYPAAQPYPTAQPYGAPAGTSPYPYQT